MPDARIADTATEALVVEAAHAWQSWDAAPTRDGLARQLVAMDRALGELVGLSGIQVRVRLCDWRRTGLSYETCIRLLLSRS